MNSKNSSSTANYKTQPAEFIIPQEKYNQMLCKILGVNKISKSHILSLLSLQDSIKSKVEKICEENGFKPKDLLERSKVGIRKEKNNENSLLLRNGKKNLTNIDGKTDEHIIKEMKIFLNKQIEKYSSDCLVVWPDGQINYAATMENITQQDDNRKTYAQAVIEAQKKNKEIGKKIAKTLSDSDYKLLDESILNALNNSHKLSHGKSNHSIEYFLRGKFPEIPKLFSSNAQKYFAKKYYPLHEEKYRDSSKELYPHDRKIVVIPLSNNGKHVCRLRGEREIINIVVTKINNWKIKLLDYIIGRNDREVNEPKYFSQNSREKLKIIQAMSDFNQSMKKLEDKEMIERNRVHVEMVLQFIIDEYYQFLRLYEYKGINELGEKRTFPLDLETISTEFRTLKDKKNHILSHEEFSEKLKNQKIKSIREKAGRDKSTKAKEEELINNIPEVSGFDGILNFYKDYIESALETKNPDLRKSRPERVKILKEYGFIYLKQGSKMNVNGDIIIKLQPTKQKSL